MNPPLLLGVILPALGAVAVLIVLRRRAVSGRLRGYATNFTLAGLGSLSLSLGDGRPDVLTFLLWFPYLSVWLIGIVEGIRWLDRRRGRGHLWK